MEFDKASALNFDPSWFIAMRFVNHFIAQKSVFAAGHFLFSFTCFFEMAELE